jgi:hypothetical protein
MLRRAAVIVATGLLLAVSGYALAAGGPKRDPGVPVPLAPRTQTTGCTLGPDPDPDCSPGAYAKKLTKKVICAGKGVFTTDDYRYVTDKTKRDVEAEYGLDTTKKYGQSLEIDHIVSLELGGSNDIANLFPEGLYAHPGYKIKDALETRVAHMVCDGKIGLRTAQRRIATDWQGLYKDVYGKPPTP